MMRLRIFIVLGTLLIAMSGGAAAQVRLDSLIQIMDKAGTPDSILLQTAIGICEKVVNTEKSYLIPRYAARALEANPVKKDSHKRFLLLNYMGNYLWQAGRLEESAGAFNRMRALGENEQDTVIISNSLMGLGTVYYQLEDYNKAIRYYKDGLALSGNDTLLRVRFYHNLANTFSNENQMDSVLMYYQESVAYHLRKNNFRLLSIAYSNIALTYVQLKNPLKMREYLDLAMQAALKSGDPYQITAVYTLKGGMAQDKHPALAEECYKKALELAIKSMSNEQIRENLDSLSHLAEKRGRHAESLVYLRRLVILDDSLDLLEERSRMVELEQEHLETRKNNENLALEYEARKKFEIQKRRQVELFILTAVIIAVLVIVFFIGLKSYRYRMKITRTKERFYSLIAHDIRNPFSGILGLSGIIREEAEKSTDPAYHKRVVALDQSLNQVYELLETLLQWSRTESGEVKYNPEYQFISPLVDEVVALLSTNGKNKGISITNGVGGTVTARFDSNMLKTVLRNLISNAIKFSRENSNIVIKAENKNKEVQLSVSDEGVGMDQEQVSRLFTSDDGFSTPGTMNETGTGLGLTLCKNFINRHGGRIWAESKPGEGTTIYFTLPD